MLFLPLFINVAVKMSSWLPLYQITKYYISRIHLIAAIFYPPASSDVQYIIISLFVFFFMYMAIWSVSFLNAKPNALLILLKLEFRNISGISNRGIYHRKIMYRIWLSSLLVAQYILYIAFGRL